MLGLEHFASTSGFVDPDGVPRIGLSGDRDDSNGELWAPGRIPGFFEYLNGKVEVAARGRDLEEVPGDVYRNHEGTLWLATLDGLFRG